MRLTNVVFALCASFFMISTVFAAKVIDKDEARDVVTLDESFKKGTRLEVFVGSHKIGLLESLGGYEAKIIYGKKEVDIGAVVRIKPPRVKSIRITYSYLSFVDIKPNLEYTLLTGELVKKPSSNGYRVKVKFESVSTRKAFLGVGVHFGYVNVGSFFSGADLGLNLISGVEIIPEVLELHFSGAGSFLFSWSKHNWARPEGTYNDDIGRNSGRAQIFIPTCLEGGAGLDFRISRKVSLFLFINYLKFFTGDWEDMEKPDNSDKNFSVKTDWLEYNVEKLGGRTLEIGLRLVSF